MQVYAAGKSSVSAARNPGVLKHCILRDDRMFVRAIGKLRISPVYQINGDWHPEIHRARVAIMKCVVTDHTLPAMSDREELQPIRQHSGAGNSPRFAYRVLSNRRSVAQVDGG